MASESWCICAAERDVVAPRWASSFWKVTTERWTTQLMGAVRSRNLPTVTIIWREIASCFQLTCAAQIGGCCSTHRQAWNSPPYCWRTCFNWAALAVQWHTMKRSGSGWFPGQYWTCSPAWSLIRAGAASAHLPAQPVEQIKNRQSPERRLVAADQTDLDFINSQMHT